MSRRARSREGIERDESSDGVEVEATAFEASATSICECSAALHSVCRGEKRT